MCQTPKRGTSCGEKPAWDWNSNLPILLPKQNLWKVKPNTVTAVEMLMMVAAAGLMLELDTTETTVHAGWSGEKAWFNDTEVSNFEIKVNAP